MEEYKNDPESINYNVSLSIIVVSYNTREITLECLRSVYRETKIPEFEIIVLDNASTDGSVEAIKSEFGEKIKFIASDNNYGFAAGNNIAIQQASGEYLLLLNPDTVVLDGAIDKLLAFANENIQAKIWGGKTLFADGSLNPASCWSKITLWSLVSQATGLSSMFRKSSLFNPEGMGSWDRNGIRQVDIVSGCFFLITKNFWDELGGFREEFFMYGEEADLCLRAQLLGAKPMVSSEASIIHYGGASEKNRPDKLIRLSKAKMLLIDKHFPFQTKRMGLWLFSLWPVSRALAHKILAKIGLSTESKYKVWREVVNRRDEWRIKGM